MLTERTPRIVAAAKLTRRSRRDEAGAFLAEGPQAAREALALALALATTDRGAVTDLFVSEQYAADRGELVGAAEAAGVPVGICTDRALTALSDTAHPQGVVARCRTLDVALSTVLDGGPRLLVVLAGISDPGNAGTVLRCADAAGADGVVFAGDAVDPYNGKAVRASAGSLFHLPVVRGVPVPAAIDAARAAGLAVLAADGRGEDDLDLLADGGGLAAPTAWVFGNEAHGLPADVAAAADRQVRVPMYGRAESLNLAAAAAICLYASARAQRRAATPRPGGDR